MSKKYGLTSSELLEVLCGPGEYGFQEEEIVRAEGALGLVFPKCYREYLLCYGKHYFNYFNNQIYRPEDVFLSYSVVEKGLEDWKKGSYCYVGEDREFVDKRYQILKDMPKEKWAKTVKNYVMLWKGRKDAWEVGYLLDDLKKGISDPPFYMGSVNELMYFKRYCPDMESFLIEMIEQAMPLISETYYKTKEEIGDCFNRYGIARAQIIEKKKTGFGGFYYVGSCYDEEEKCLHYYYSFDGYTRLWEVRHSSKWPYFGGQSQAIS